MALREYRAKRNFSRTPEPKGKHRAGGKSVFVVQKHAASRLHYDFRLEINGALASWAVPKGPSLDPTQRRLAVQVEDHPLEYGDFEGTIPAGQYGAGTVMVWDSGTWRPQGSAKQGVKEGKLKFVLNGQKLHGGWTLVRMNSRNRRGDKANWLLIKERDQWARSPSADDVLGELPDSAASGRSLEEIAAGRPARMKKRRKKRTAVPKRRAGRFSSRNAPQRRSPGVGRQPRKKPSRRGAKSPSSLRTRARPTVSKLLGARRATFPRHPQCQLATLVAKPPSGDLWFHEMKFDGYRMLCSVKDGKVHFVSRNGHDWTARLQPLVAPVLKLNIKEAILDGEVVVLDSHGISHFQALQNAFRGGGPLVYYVFDLLYLDGYDLTPVALEKRKSILETLLSSRPTKADRIRYSEHVVGSGPQFLQKMCDGGLEGMVSKRRDAPYVAGRTAAWLKSKCRQEQEFVVGGFTRPTGSRVGFGALLLGYYRPDGKLAYAGRVGTGFNTHSLRDLHKLLKHLQQPRSPFVDVPRSEVRGVNWVKPKLVAQIEFNNWTDDGLLRQASFQGLREDKPARQVTREIPARGKP